MLTRRTLVALGLAAALPAATRAEADFIFPSIDGGTIALNDLRGKPLLVVNTASFCAFTPQYEALQRLHEAYAGRATILAVPSDDFGGQEYDSAGEVKDFCEVNFGITLPMTDITRVRGPEAHPFFAWAAGQGVVPRWNFHKILLDAEGRIVAEFPSMVRPDAPQLTRAIDGLL